MSATEPMEVDTSSAATPASKEENPAIVLGAIPEEVLNRPCGLRKVSSRALCEFKHTNQLAKVFADAIAAHARLYNDVGILHGDINTNTIVIIDTLEGKSHGALVDFDMPVCAAAIRKIGNPDPAVPPPQRVRPYYWR